MSATSSPYRERRCALTPLGETVALDLRLRQAIATMPELDQHRAVLELRQLVDRLAPRPARPVA